MHDPAVNEDLLDRYMSESIPAHRIYEPSRLIAVLGASCDPGRDLILENLAADGVPHLRRRGGGGAVILSPGQVVLALVTEVGFPFRNREYAAEINSWFVEALSALGFHGALGIQHEGISDLAIGGKKILGTSIYRKRLVLFYQASLLVSNDTALFTRYLRIPVRAPEYRKGRSHEEFCTTLSREARKSGQRPDGIDAREVMDALEKVVDARLPALR